MRRVLLKSRLFIAAILVPVLYLAITTSTPLFFFLMVSTAILLGQYEFYRLYFPVNGTGAIAVGLICELLLLFGFYLHPSSILLFEILQVIILLTILIFHLFYARTIQQALSDAGVVLMGVFYLGLLGHLIMIRQRPAGIGFLLFLLFVVWGGDAGAYYVGRSVGGRKLYPAVSPNKTVSGAIGGLLVSVLSCAIAKLFLMADLVAFPWSDALALSLVLGIAGQLGDLTESLFKRSAGVKDSGGIIPAHGGVLDKLDGVAFSAPLLYYYLWAFGR